MSSVETKNPQEVPEAASETATEQAKEVMPDAKAAPEAQENGQEEPTDKPDKSEEPDNTEALPANGSKEPSSSQQESDVSDEAADDSGNPDTAEAGDATGGTDSGEALSESGNPDVPTPCEEEPSNPEESGDADMSGNPEEEDGRAASDAGSNSPVRPASLPHNTSAMSEGSANDLATTSDHKVASTGEDESAGLTVDDLEDVLLELNNYEKQTTLEIPSLLESYLKFVANSGCTHFPWNKIKRLFRVKLEHVIKEYFEASPVEDIPPMPNVDVFNFSNVKDKVFEQLESFAGIPFTIQRIAELLTTPKRHYRRTDKFMRALEKNILVVSHTEPRSHAQDDCATKFMNGGGADRSFGAGGASASGDNSPLLTASADTPPAGPRRAPMLVRAGSVNAKLMTSVAAERTAQWASQAQAANSTTSPTTTTSPTSQNSNVDSEVEKSSGAAAADKQNGMSSKESSVPGPTCNSSSGEGDEMEEDDDMGEPSAKRGKVDNNEAADKTKGPLAADTDNTEQAPDKNDDHSATSTEGPCDSLDSSTPNYEDEDGDDGPATPPYAPTEAELAAMTEEQAEACKEDARRAAAARGIGSSNEAAAADKPSADTADTPAETDDSKGEATVAEDKPATLADKESSGEENKEDQSDSKDDSTAASTTADSKEKENEEEEMEVDAECSSSGAVLQVKE